MACTTARAHTLVPNRKTNNKLAENGKKVLSSLRNLCIRASHMLASWTDNARKIYQPAQHQPNIRFINSINWMITSFPYTNLRNNIQLMCHGSEYTQNMPAHYYGFHRRRRLRCGGDDDVSTHSASLVFVYVAFALSLSVPFHSILAVRSAGRSRCLCIIHIIF